MAIRFQKMVELAPSTISDRALIGRVIESALRMAKSVRSVADDEKDAANETKIQYSSLGTFEFLVHESKPEFYFLEVNPRLQVEHTVTEEISGVDIVRTQLLLARGASIESLNLPSRGNIAAPLGNTAIQLRITAEDADKGFTLSMGRVTQFQHPPGFGVRIDTHLSNSKPTTVGSSYDSLLAKLIVRGPSLEAARLKGLRALSDLTIKGVRTNMNVLMGILSHRDFQTKQCSTRWLETNLQDVISHGAKLESQGTLSLREPYITSTTSDISSSSTAGLGTAALLFRKGEAFKMKLTDITSNQKSSRLENTAGQEFILRFDRVLNNNFPLQFAADVTFHSSSSSKAYALNLASTTQTSAASSLHRCADPNDKTHVALPFPGQFVEMYVEEGDIVEKGELLCVIRQMKMELEVRAPSAGTIRWTFEAEPGEQVNEGLLLCELTPDENAAAPARGAKL
jgi:pyruvate carboxylase